MFATTAGLKKVIESDGRRRLLYSRPHNELLLSSSRRMDRLAALATNDGIFTLFRASLSMSHIAWPSSNYSSNYSSSSMKDDLSKTILLSAPSSSSLSTSAENRENDNDNDLYKQHQPERGLSLQSTPLRSNHFSRNRRTDYRLESKLRFHPQYESRAFLSSSSSSSSSTSSEKSTAKTTISNASDYSTHAKIPIPKSSPTLSTSSNPLDSIDPKKILKGSLDVTRSLTKSLFKIIIRLPGNVLFFATHSKERREKIADIKEFIKKEVDHYWVGAKVSRLEQQSYY